MSERRWIFEDAAQKYRVVLSDEVVKYMFRLCDANRAQETGGILLGSYSQDYATAQVLEATDPPADSKFGRDWFNRGTNGLEDMLVASWNSEPRVYYLGEWHVHTANIPWPSQQDKRQMREIGKDRGYRCSHPLLLIVCPKPEGGCVLTCFVFPAEMPSVALQLVESP